MFGVTTPCVDAPRASGSRSSATRCSSSTRRVPAASRWRRSRRRVPGGRARRRRRPSSRTSSSAACSRPAPTGSRPPARRACRRSSRSARSTWSTSARARSVPPQFDGRNLYVHNPTVTLMRTTPEECAELGRMIGRKLSAATGPTVLFIPLGGVSMIAAPGQPFDDAGRGRGARSPGCARRSAIVEVHERERGHQRRRVRDGDGRPPARADPGAVPDDARRGARAPARAGRPTVADHRRGRRNRAVGQARRGGRRRPDHHLQQRPLPHGRSRARWPG